MLETRSESDFRSGPDGVVLGLPHDELVSTSGLMAVAKLCDSVLCRRFS